MATVTPPTQGGPGRARLWLYRALAAVLAPVLVLCALEGALRLAGYGRPTGFFIPASRPGYVRTNPEFVASILPSAFDLRPLPSEFPRKKAPGALRVFVLGESAAQGVPAPAFGMAAQLRAQLRARYPGRVVEVVNTGIVAINSHVVLRIARDAAALEPDLFVVYMGNNEVVGPYGPGCAYLSQMPPLWVVRLSTLVRSTRTGQWFGSLAAHLGPRGGRREEWGGMAMFVNNAVAGDDPRLEAVYANFEANLRDIVRAGEGAGARVVLCTPVANLRDCAPFLSVHRAGLAPGDLADFDRALGRGRIEWLLGDAGDARRDLGDALRIDPQHAEASYLLGKLDLDRGDVAAARAHLVDALHWDGLRFRPDPRVAEVIRRVAGESGRGAILVDTALALGSDPASGAPPAGRDLLFEHVHLDWEGNWRVASLVADAVAGRAGGLESRGCAAALAYTAFERADVLRRAGSIVHNPPFTNQVSFGEDEAVFARELERAEALHASAEVRRQCAPIAVAAAAADPDNAELAHLASRLLESTGNLAGAAAQAARASELLPSDPELVAARSLLLSRQGLLGEAEGLLAQARARFSPKEQVQLVPAYVELASRSGRSPVALAAIDALLAVMPGDGTLRVLRARVQEGCSDEAAAEREYRAALQADPTNQAALKGLLGLLDRAGRTAEADALSQQAAERQPGNHVNNLRAAVAWQRGGNDSRSVACLSAAESSGPVSAGVEVALARACAAQGRPDEALLHLGRARRQALVAANGAEAEAIGKAAEGLMARLRQ